MQPSVSPLKTPKYVIIEGPIGVGKTSLSRLLTDRWGAKPLFETFEDNPFLTGGFYDDRESYAFNTEIFFLLSRYRQLQNLPHTPLVSDYFFEKNKLFAEMNLKKEDLETYLTLYHSFESKVPTPDLVVYLDASVQTLVNRIYMRDRHFERSMPSNYLLELSQRYRDFFLSYDKAPVLTISTEGMDFVRDPQHFNKLVGQIEDRLLGYRQLTLQPFGREVSFG